MRPPRISGKGGTCGGAAYALLFLVPLNKQPSDSEIERLAALNRYRILDTPPEATFDRLTRLAARVFRMPIVFLSLIDHRRMWVKSCVGPVPPEMDRRMTFCDKVIESGEMIIVPDAIRDERFRSLEVVQNDPRVRFYAGLPLRTEEGHAIGTFCLLDVVPRELTDEEVLQLRDFGAVATEELEHRLANLRLAEEIQRREQVEDELEERVVQRTAELATANAALRVAEARAREFVEQAVEGIFQSTPEGNYLSANAALARMYGYVSVEDLLGSLNDIRAQLYVDPETRDRFVSRMETDGEVNAFESEIHRRDGSRIWISESARAVRDAEGKTLYFEGMVKDITARKRTERALKENKALLESLVQERTMALESKNVELRAEIVERRRIEAALKLAATENSRLIAAIQSSDAGVLISDPNAADAPTIFVNAAFERITGYRWEEVIGRNCRFLQGPETDPAMIAEIRDCVARKVPFKGLILNYRRDGTRFWNELNINPVFDDKGRLVNFIGIQSDVTVRVEAQEKVRASEEALRESEERLQAILDQTSAFVSVMDTEGRYVLVNRRFDDTFRRPGESLLGRRTAELVEAETAQAWRKNDLRVMEAGRAMEFEEIMMLPDGEHTYLAVKFPLRDRAGRVYALCSISTDITERKRQEEVLRQSRDEAERANHAKSDFLSRMSHELRTPLNAILGFSQLLQLQPLSRSDSENVEFISKAGKHLLDLINEVLDLARIETGRVTLAPEAVEVAEVLEEAVCLVRPAAAKQGLTILPGEMPGGGWYVTADRQRLKQVLLNLLSNAVKYNRLGGTVTLSCRKARNARLAIGVTDTGAGIPADKMGSLFVPFERLGAELTKVEGSGIGLALSQRLARAQGGDIEVESTPGVGTTFSLRLPMAPARPERPRELEARPTGTYGQEADRKLPVLYIEDNPANTELMVKVVAKHPAWELFTAATGEEGLKRARELMPALILLDLQLPDIDGAAVLRQLRADPQLSGRPIIMVSADAMSQQARRLMSAGATAYLTKPIDIAEVLRLLDEYARATVS